jgi:hypothetical protein
MLLSGARRSWSTMTSGVILKQVVKSGHLEGSWESSLMVRCQAGKVEVSGNPSKWGRLESVGSGCQSVMQAIGVYNIVLDGLGLPRFTFPDRLTVMGQGGAVDRTVRQGPRIQWIHIAANLILGSRDALGPYFDWLSTQRVGQRGHRLAVKGPCSVRAGTRRRRTLAIYGKGSEVAQQLAHWRRKRNGDIETAQAYLTALSERCEALGLVRLAWVIGNYREEFLFRWSFRFDSSALVWCRTPGVAYRFNSERARQRVVSRLARDDLVVMGLFDFGDDWAVNWPDEWLARWRCEADHV